MKPNKIIAMLFYFLLVGLYLTGCCQNENSRKAALKECIYIPTSTMKFIAFAPFKASTGQVIEAEAFLTEEGKVSFYGQHGSEKIINDSDLSNKVTFELIPTEV